MEPISEILSRMTVSEKIGQLFLAHCPEKNVEEAIGEYHPGGILLFAREFEPETPDSMRRKIESFQRAANLPLLIAADEEGGKVVRASKFPQFRAKPFGSPKEVFAEGGYDAVSRDAEEKAEFLRALGVNYDLAPVCDYTLDETKYIAGRVFGVSPEATAEFIRLTVRGMTKGGVLTSLKHFPGYGGNSDTHKDLAYDTRPFECFDKEDLVPFRAGIKEGVPSVMVSHNIVKCIDGDYPASLSPAVHRLLRETMGFDGVIITDSLTMSGVRNFTAEDPCTQALLCGNDMIITSYWRDGIRAMLADFSADKIPEKRLDEAVGRVLTMKRRIGLI